MLRFAMSNHLAVAFPRFGWFFHVPPSGANECGGNRMPRWTVLTVMDRMLIEAKLQRSSSVIYEFTITRTK